MPLKGLKMEPTDRIRAVLLTALLFCAVSARAAEPHSLEHGSPRYTITPESHPRLLAALGLDDERRPVFGGQELLDVSFPPGAVLLEFTHPQGRAPLRLYVSRLENPALIRAPATLLRTPEIHIYTPRSDVHEAEPSMIGVLPALREITWSDGAEEPSRAVGRRLPVADAPIGTDMPPLTSWLVLAMVLALIAGTGIAARGLFAPGAPLALLPGRSRLLPMAALLALSAGAAALRFGFGLPCPPTASSPWVHGPIAGGLLAAALPPLLLALGTAWGGRALGWTAALFAAGWPAHIRFAQSTEPTMWAATFLLWAVLATELFARRSTRPAALAAGLGWSLTALAHPPAATYLLLLGLWFAMDPRLRRSTRSLPRSAPLALGVIGAIMVGSLMWGATKADFTTTPSSAGAYLAALGPAAHAMFWDPHVHPLPAIILAPLGFLMWCRRSPRGDRGTPRPLWALLLLGGLVIPLLLAPSAGLSPLAGRDVRHGLLGWPLLFLLAGLPVSRLLCRPLNVAREKRTVALAARVLGVALLVAATSGPLTKRDYIRTPSPLQLQQTFIARHAHRISPRAVIAVAGLEHDEYDVAGPIATQLRASFRASRASQDGEDLAQMIAEVSGLRPATVPEDTPVYYLQGFFDYVWPALPVAPPASATAAESHENPWLAQLRRDWKLTRMVCVRPNTHRYPEALPDQRRSAKGTVATLSPDGLMELCLYRLTP